jgi:hypothetical protein
MFQFVCKHEEYLVTHDEALAAMDALNRWAMSQELSPQEATLVTSMYCGSICGVFAETQDELDVALVKLERLLQATAQDWFEQVPGKHRRTKSTSDLSSCG